MSGNFKLFTLIFSCFLIGLFALGWTAKQSNKDNDIKAKAAQDAAEYADSLAQIAAKEQLLLEQSVDSANHCFCCNKNKP